MTETEIQIVERGLGFAPTPTKINETDLRSEFNEFSKTISSKWFFQNEPSEKVCEKLPFLIKSSWNPPNGHPTT